MPTTSHLRLVRDDAPEPESKKPATWQGSDPVFFHKGQIKLGTRLLYFGRTEHASVWEVIEVKSYRASKASGRIISRKVDGVMKLSDELVLRRIGGNMIRQVSFSYISYSAIWRLA